MDISFESKRQQRRTAQTVLAAAPSAPSRHPIIHTPRLSASLDIAPAGWDHPVCSLPAANGNLATIVILLLFWVGKGRECITHPNAEAPCEGLPTGLASGLKPVWTVNTGGPGYIPLSEIDRAPVNGLNLVKRSSTQNRIALLPSFMKRIAFQLFFVKSDIISLLSLRTWPKDRAQSDVHCLCTCSRFMAMVVRVQLMGLFSPFVVIHFNLSLGDSLSATGGAPSPVAV